MFNCIWIGCLLPCLWKSSFLVILTLFFYELLLNLILNRVPWLNRINYFFFLFFWEEIQLLLYITLSLSLIEGSVAVCFVKIAIPCFIITVSLNMYSTLGVWTNNKLQMLELEFWNFVAAMPIKLMFLTLWEYKQSIFILCYYHRWIWTLNLGNYMTEFFEGKIRT